MIQGFGRVMCRLGGENGELVKMGPLEGNIYRKIGLDAITSSIKCHLSSTIRNKLTLSSFPKFPPEEGLTVKAVFSPHEVRAR